MTIRNILFAGNIIDCQIISDDTGLN